MVCLKSNARKHIFNNTNNKFTPQINNNWKNKKKIVFHVSQHKQTNKNDDEQQKPSFFYVGIMKIFFSLFLPNGWRTAKDKPNIFILTMGQHSANHYNNKIDHHEISSFLISLNESWILNLLIVFIFLPDLSALMPIFGNWSSK